MSLLDYSLLTEEQARERLELVRWPNGPVCPHCGNNKAVKLQGKSTRPGVYKCKTPKCRKQFTVTIGSIFEDSHIPLKTWLFAFHLICSSKKGASSLQLSRQLSVSYKCAWHMTHRIRFAMRRGSLNKPLEGIVEIDETYVGGSLSNMHAYKKAQILESGEDNKVPVVALVQRGGEARTKVIPRITGANVKDFILKNVHPDAQIMTDTSPIYTKIGRKFKSHRRVNHHKKQYVRGIATTNGVEGFFSLLKRSITGSFHHVSEQHLPRYCDEVAFRWTHRKLNDDDRTTEALKRATGGRLVFSDLPQKVA